MNWPLAVSIVALALALLSLLLQRISIVGFTGSNGIEGRLKALENFHAGFDKEMTEQRHGIVNKADEACAKRILPILERLDKVEKRLYP